MAIDTQKMLDTAESLVGTPYTWGGGHSGWLSVAAAKQFGLDCSGFVSQVLHAGGVKLSGPQATGGLAQSLTPGKGAVTVYDKTSGTPDQQHTIINILGKWFESGGNPANNPSGGVSQLTDSQAQAELSGGGFAPYHPAGVNSYSKLSTLWVRNGGPANVANIMAAIAMAESSGVVGATHKNQNGSIDNGLWQINNQAHPQFNQQQLLSDPDYNAAAAVAVYKSQGLGAWSTYSSGAYLSYLPGASKDRITSYGGPGGGRTRPGGDSSDSGPSVDLTTAYVDWSSSARTAPTQYVSLTSDLLAPFKWSMNESGKQFSDFWHDLTLPYTAIVDAKHATDQIVGESVRILDALPFYFLRFVEFTSGLVLMGTGLYVTSQRSNRSPRQSAPARAMKTLVGGTVIGREMRIAKATKAGRREGQEEHYRLTARREARAAEASKAPRNMSEYRRSNSEGAKRYARNQAKRERSQTKQNG